VENSVSHLCGHHLYRKEEEVSQEQLSQEVMPDNETENEHI
jgi:hypothetical protein